MQGLGLLVILFCFGLAGGMVGKMKGGSFSIWFLVSFCVPFLGLIAAVCHRREDRELRRQCPDCGRVTKLYDAVCVSCGSELEFPDVAIASEMAVRMGTVRGRPPGSASQAPEGVGGATG